VPSPSEPENRMIRGLLLDLKGVLYESGHTIAGAVQSPGFPGYIALQPVIESRKIAEA